MPQWEQQRAHKAIHKATRRKCTFMHAFVVVRTRAR